MLAPRPQPNDLQLAEMAAGCVRASSELGFMVSLGYQNPFHAGWSILKNATLWIQRQIQAWQRRVAFTYVRAESASRCFSGRLLPLSSL